MQITLFTTSSAPETLEKELTQIGSVLALTPTAPVDILNPDIILAYNSAFLQCNFCYIDTFKRYYFVKVTADGAQRLVLHCNVDPLMSYKEYLKLCSISVVRSETIGANFVIDKQLPVDPSRYFVEGKFFPLSPLDYESIIPGRRFILLVNGG